MAGIKTLSHSAFLWQLLPFLHWMTARPYKRQCIKHPQRVHKRTECKSIGAETVEVKEENLGLVFLLLQYLLFLKLLWWLNCPLLYLERRLFLCTFHTLQGFLFEASSPEHRLTGLLSWHIPLWRKLDTDFLLQSCCIWDRALLKNNSPMLYNTARFGHSICQ